MNAKQPIALWIVASALIPVQSAFSQCQIQKVVSDDSTQNDQFGFAISISDDVLVVGAYNDDDPLIGAGSAYVFRNIDGNWVEQQKLTASDSEMFAAYAIDVAVWNDVIVIGAYLNDGAGGEDSGVAYVYRFDGSSWQEEAVLEPLDAQSGDSFGVSVAVNSDRIVVGAVLGDSPRAGDSGAVYLFQHDGRNWIEETKLAASDASASDTFGISVSLTSDTLLVGANGADDFGAFSGAAYIFEESGGVWTQVAKLLASDGEASDQFGFEVDLLGTRAIVGSRNNNSVGNNAGAAYVYDRGAGQWEVETKLIADDGASNDHFGSAVALGTDIALVGAWADDDFGGMSGSAYIFELANGKWEQTDKLIPNDSQTGDGFGISVNMFDGIAAIGAFQSDDGGSQSGSAYVFQVAGDDCGMNGNPDACEIDGNDCNENGVYDACESDCNGDGVIDACDPDCQPNSVSDICEILSGTVDCNANLVPDDCENDCNKDGMIDACDPDCQDNGISDICEVQDGAADCNGNLMPDECESDCNNDQLPDDCVLPIVFSEGSRYLAITPQPTCSETPVAIRVRSTEFPCLDKFVSISDGWGVLVDVPTYLLPSEWGTILVSGDDIVPATDYEVLIDNSSVKLESSPVSTHAYGDIDGNGVANFADILEAVFCFQGDDRLISSADIAPCIPNQTCNFEDIQWAVRAFQENQHADLCLLPCDVCPIRSASNCQDSNGQFIVVNDRALWETGDIDRWVDDFQPTASGPLSLICYQPAYFNPSAGTECSAPMDIPVDDFEMRIYEDAGGLPGSEIGSSQALTVLASQRNGRSRIWTYSFLVPNPPNVNNEQCYWLEITGAGDGPDGCRVYAALSADGNGYVLNDRNGVFGSEDIVISIGDPPDTAVDLAFCVESGMTESGCGTTLGGCCSATSCLVGVTASECQIDAGFFSPGADSCISLASKPCEAPFCPCSTDLSNIEDLCANGLPCSADFDTDYCSSGAPANDCDGAAATWFSYTTSPGECGVIEISTCENGNYDGVIAVWKNQCPSNDEPPIACSDDSCGVAGGMARVLVEVEEGQEIYIMVGGWLGDTGQGMLTLQWEELFSECGLP